MERQVLQSEINSFLFISVEELQGSSVKKGAPCCKVASGISVCREILSTQAQDSWLQPPQISETTP